ncbi:uncharacterized protein BDZ99DRAFT_474582 [Mytilinidion resinicola]|uniref:Uncharacterized protein n=1 Tax=Mytilinidion resinicola TaxID=574789 RepID=A0A6A6YV34_9PEZI|nr:uncharacterized protein BDZ99DRAFT_474582 [Mytilinidion resinicola]KAF2812408.1 hypothetical protein BDZ99DRAFT_474582 [Mytilinidion resinicola]
MGGGGRASGALCAPASPCWRPGCRQRTTDGLCRTHAVASADAAMVCTRSRLKQTQAAEREGGRRAAAPPVDGHCLNFTAPARPYSAASSLHARPFASLFSRRVCICAARRRYMSLARPVREQPASSLDRIPGGALRGTAPPTTPSRPHDTLHRARRLQAALAAGWVVQRPWRVKACAGHRHRGDQPGAGLVAKISWAETTTLERAVASAVELLCPATALLLHLDRLAALDEACGDGSTCPASPRWTSPLERLTGPLSPLSRPRLFRPLSSPHRPRRCSTLPRRLMPPRDPSSRRPSLCC